MKKQVWYNMEILVAFSLVVSILSIFTIGPIISSNEKYSHTVKVDMVEHTNEGPVVVCGVYDIKGEDFTIEHDTSHGKDIISLVGTRTGFLNIKYKDRVVVYGGQYDINVTRIEILK